eukprot:GHVP01032968.1.p1 GENE.GHVP01032968.1~~GHVP01032968.1.p1  ORF type:complete len:653 (+),score=134.91 GHVP01032968.1:45-1961(+)
MENVLEAFFNTTEIEKYLIVFADFLKKDKYGPSCASDLLSTCSNYYHSMVSQKSQTKESQILFVKNLLRTVVPFVPNSISAYTVIREILEIFKIMPLEVLAEVQWGVYHILGPVLQTVLPQSSSIVRSLSPVLLTDVEQKLKNTSYSYLTALLRLVFNRARIFPSANAPKKNVSFLPLEVKSKVPKLNAKETAAYLAYVEIEKCLQGDFSPTILKDLMKDLQTLINYFNETPVVESGYDRLSIPFKNQWEVWQERYDRFRGPSFPQTDETSPEEFSRKKRKVSPSPGSVSSPDECSVDDHLEIGDSEVVENNRLEIKRKRRLRDFSVNLCRNLPESFLRVIPECYSSAQRTPVRGMGSFKILSRYSLMREEFAIRLWFYLQKLLPENVPRSLPGRSNDTGKIVEIANFLLRHAKLYKVGLRQTLTLSEFLLHMSDIENQIMALPKTDKNSTLTEKKQVNFPIKKRPVRKSRSRAILRAARNLRKFNLFLASVLYESNSKNPFVTPCHLDNERIVWCLPESAQEAENLDMLQDPENSDPAIEAGSEKPKKPDIVQDIKDLDMVHQSEDLDNLQDTEDLENVDEMQDLKNLQNTEDQQNMQDTEHLGDVQDTDFADVHQSEDLDDMQDSEDLDDMQDSED